MIFEVKPQNFCVPSTSQINNRKSSIINLLSGAAAESPLTLARCGWRFAIMQLASRNPHRATRSSSGWHPFGMLFLGACLSGGGAALTSG
ncbi:MAG: hypothetical protein GTO03_08235 [Planctomycetales bacterium]|nr:hypothetical protein [Planctomycetales bacterium]